MDREPNELLADPAARLGGDLTPHALARLVVRIAPDDDSLTAHLPARLDDQVV